MADIDKALPNEPRKEFEIPGQEEVQEQIVESIEEEKQSPDEVEVTENEDGSVDINLDPAAASPEGGDTSYNKMVTEMYIKAGGKEGTGMDIDSFAEQYFKKFSTGGRVNYDEGGSSLDPDTLALRKRVEELMDDGETFGDAVKKAVKELENG